MHSSFAGLRPSGSEREMRHSTLSSGPENGLTSSLGTQVASLT